MNKETFERNNEEIERIISSLLESVKVTLDMSTDDKGDIVKDDRNIYEMKAVLEAALDRINTLHMYWLWGQRD